MKVGALLLSIKDLKKQALEVYGHGRALVYTAESLPLPLLHRLIVGHGGYVPTAAQQNYLITKIKETIKQEAQDFVDLGLPIRSLQPEPTQRHFKRWLKIMADSGFSFWRKRHNDNQSFSNRVKNIEQFPDYYRRNFHFQTDGYLSEQSAHFYEHQVELLFRGLAQPMRRRLLMPMAEKLQSIARPKILEIACGTGVFTADLQMTFPNAHITAVDISPAYIQYAKKRFLKHQNLDFLVANAENLPFADQNFDAVVSVFLHHELPVKIREQVIRESLRVCKQDGFWGLVDSIQIDDDPQLNWAIKEFPKNFHEPFFKNYIQTPLLPFLEKLKSPKQELKEEIFFLSKILYRT